jgi:radical SAM superfamily enzyme with C-terminal helix-hairpin-helix motif
MYGHALYERIWIRRIYINNVSMHSVAIVYMHPQSSRRKQRKEKKARARTRTELRTKIKAHLVIMGKQQMP